MSDQTQEIQSWIDEQRKAVNSRRSLEAGVYEVSDTLRIGRSMGLKLSGGGGMNRSPSSGWDPFRCGTILKWSGPPDKPIIDVSGATGLVIEGINLVGPARQGILFRHGGGCLDITLRDMGLMGMDIGVQCGTTLNEQTCANIDYCGVHWESIREACVRLMNAQSVQHQFQSPLFANAPIGVDVQAGGDVSIFGGGSYELGTLLKLGNVSQNTRGFDVASFRFDGDGTRTAWLDAYDTDRAKTYGVVRFQSCGQNKGQGTTIPPLFTVPPGCRCVADCCDFNGAQDNWARVYSDARAGGEFIANYCSGLDGTNLASLVTRKGQRAHCEFNRCGNLYSQTGSYSTFPGG